MLIFQLFKIPLGYHASVKLGFSRDHDYQLAEILNRLWTNIGLNPIRVLELANGKVIARIKTEPGANRMIETSQDFFKGFPHDKKVAIALDKVQPVP